MLSVLWDGSESEARLGRCFTFSFMPSGLLSRVIMNVLPHVTPLCLWFNGILAEGDHEADLVLAEIVSRTHESATLQVEVRSPDVRRREQLFSTVVESLDHTMAWWPNLRVEAFTLEINGEKASVASINAALAEGRTVIPLGGMEVPVGMSFFVCVCVCVDVSASISPDLMIVEFHGPRISLAEAQKKVSRLITN